MLVLLLILLILLRVLVLLLVQWIWPHHVRFWRVLDVSMLRRGWFRLVEAWVVCAVLVLRGHWLVRRWVAFPKFLKSTRERRHDRGIVKMCRLTLFPGPATTAPDKEEAPAAAKCKEDDESDDGQDDDEDQVIGFAITLLGVSLRRFGTSWDSLSVEDACGVENKRQSGFGVAVVAALSERFHDYGA